MFQPRKPRIHLRRCRLLVGRDGQARPISLTPIGGCVFDLLCRVGSRGITFDRPPPQDWRKGLEELRRRGVLVVAAPNALGRLTYVLHQPGSGRVEQ